jgi:hypothetical protein
VASIVQDGPVLIGVGAVFADASEAAGGEAKLEHARGC